MPPQIEYGRMNRQTRSGAVFAAWGPPTVIETGISLGPYLEAALASADKRADQREDGLPLPEKDTWQGLYGDERDDDWEDDVVVSSRPASPMSDTSETSDASSAGTFDFPSRASSPTTSIGDNDANDDPYLDMPPLQDVHDDDDVPPSSRPVERRRRNQAAGLRRARKRVAKAAQPKDPFEKKPNPRYDQGYRTLPPEHVEFPTEELPHSTWQGLRTENRKGRRGRKLWTVAELEAMGYRVIKWDGR